MFTGLIQKTGTLREKISNEGGAHLFFECPSFSRRLKAGDSVACNGVCLSVNKTHKWGFSTYAVFETLEKSNLGEISVDSPVNFELPLTLSDGLGGHLVAGHVDGCGTVVELKALPDKSGVLSVTLPGNLAKYCVSKGSIALNGVSLTLASVTRRRISAALIPITLESTNLSDLKPGDRVNVEVDLMAKQVEKILEPYLKIFKKQRV